MERVIILVSHPLFGQGVESLLRREGGMEIVARDTDTARAIEHVRQMHPDVLIMDSADPACASIPFVMQVSQVGNGTRVIGLNLRENEMCLFWGEQRVVTGVKDLIEAIRRPARKSRGPGRSGRGAEIEEVLKKAKPTATGTPKGLVGEDAPNSP